MNKELLVFCAALSFLSCNTEKENVGEKVSSKPIESGSEEWEQRKIEEANQMWELGKKKYPSSTYDLLPIKGDTLIAATQYNGLVLTTNAGETWNDAATPGGVWRLTIDNQGQLWGIKSWRGIHEPDLCILYLSQDLGKSWKKYELDTEKIFPKRFYSRRNQPLRIVDYNGQIFQLSQINPKLSWTLVDSVLKSEEEKVLVIDSRRVVRDSKDREWLFNRQGIFLLRNDTIKVY